MPKSKKLKQHSGRKHALLSASGSNRWLNCTPSARLSEKFPDTDSVYAREGTLAHEFAETYLLYALGTISMRARNRRLNKLRKEDLFTNDMEGHIFKYIDYCNDRHAIAKKIPGGFVVSVEERLNFSRWVPEGFGTGDFTLITDKVLELIDLKYGKGVKVYAADNSQIMLYGLGAYEAYSMFYDFDTIKLTIVQPRLNHLHSHEIKVTELLSWANEHVKPNAKKAFKGEGNYSPGEWCRWCPAKAKCRALADHNLSLLKMDFKDPYLLSDKELTEVYSKLETLSIWAKAVKDYMLSATLKGGKDFEGLKLVEGRSNRKWKDPEKVASILLANGFSTEEIYTTPKINGILKIANLMSVDKFEQLLNKHVIKPPGAPVLVTTEDNRVEFGLARARRDFKD